MYPLCYCRTSGQQCVKCNHCPGRERHLTVVAQGHSEVLMLHWAKENALVVIFLVSLTHKATTYVVSCFHLSACAQFKRGEANIPS